jgi:cephalosporin hydroxylase
MGAVPSTPGEPSVAASEPVLAGRDANMNGQPMLPGSDPGPAEAVQGFLAERSDLELDRPRERLLMTFNPGSFLHWRS